MGVLDEPWADRHERRLRKKLTRRLPNGERLLVAAIVFTGPGPNLLGLVEDVMSQKMFAGFRNRRKYFTIALTDRRLLLLSNIGENSPTEIVHEYADVTEIEELNTIDGDTWIKLGGKRFWFWPTWVPQIEELIHSVASERPG